MDITEIKGESLSVLVADHFECQICRVVDREHERSRVGYLCPVCGRSDVPILHFHMNIRVLLDLIQTSYHSVGSQIEELHLGEGAHDISVIIFFCTLREALLDNLIVNLMRAQNLPQGIMKRLWLIINFIYKSRINYLNRLPISNGRKPL